MNISPYSELDLSDLRRLRDEWYAQGKKVAKTLRLIIDEFGKPVENHYTCITYKALRRDHLVASLYESFGKYAGDHYEHRAKIWIEVDGVEAVRVYFRDMEIETKSDSVFIPNIYIDELLAMADQAREKIQTRADTLDERERQKLIEFLGIGKIV